MSPDDKAVLNLLFLAKVAEEKGQLPGRDRFLVVSLTKAVRAGLLPTAEVCRDKILQSNPHHLLRKYESAAAAMRDSDFQFYVRQQERHCPPERAEQLATDLDFDPETWLQKNSADLPDLLSFLLDTEC